MDVPRLEQFLREKYLQGLHKAVGEDKSVLIDFSVFDRFDPVSADQLLNDPENTLKAFDQAAEAVVGEKIRVRFNNLPLSRGIRIRNLRAKHLNQLWSIDATIKSASEVKPQIYEAIFECPECHERNVVPQDSSILKKPDRCQGTCGGRRGDFPLVEKRLYDVRWLQGIEPFEITTGEQPGEISILLKEDLTTPRMQKRTDPGSRLRITGILKELPKRIKGKLSTKMDMYIGANYAEPSDIEFEELDITPEDEKKILALARDPDIYEKLKASIAPGLWGFDEIKEAVMLQLFGGLVHRLPDGSRIRGNLHILLTGDPAIGKSVLLKLITSIIPRGRYVSGSGVTGAGLTASVIKNEVIGSWVLEAGALILCNKGLIGIDEFDKMSRDDQIAMHEAMSVESYHGDTPITLANGEVKPIRELVEGILEKNKDKKIKGDECYFVNIDGPEILGSDFSEIVPKKSIRVSKHTAPQYFYKITLQNGKSVTVTPNHPCFVFDGENIIEKPAEKLSAGEFVPIPKTMPGEGKEQIFNIDPRNITSERYNIKHIKVPVHNSPEFCKFVGYVISEGSHEMNRGKINGISFTNSDERLLEDFENTVFSLFGLKPYIQRKEGRTMLRYISTELGNFVRLIEPSLLKNASSKSIPHIIFRCRSDDIAFMLRAMFDGDGSVYGKKDSLYVTYTTSSEVLANQLHELLLRFSIASYVTSAKPSGRTKQTVFRVIITGSENLERFVSKIGFSDPAKNRKIENFLRSKTYRATYSEKIPVSGFLMGVVKSMRLSQEEVFGTTIDYKKYNVSRKTLLRAVEFMENHIQKLKECRKKIPSCSIQELRQIRKELKISTYYISDFLKVCHQMVSYIELKNVEKYHEAYRSALVNTIDTMLENEVAMKNWRALASGDIALCTVKKVEKIENKSEKWVYDITVPGEVFVSNGMVLHNTVSIAKASIVATLPAQTAVLAGANPKYGRFDLFKPIAEQIDIPETLLSRFDLKFALKDLPDKATDAKLADHIISTRRSPQVAEPLIDRNLLRKYIAYARQIEGMELTEEAAGVLKDFYVDMRNRSATTETNAVSITLRQYEALIRLAEASAKVRLDTKIRMEDASRAIKLMQHSLTQLGYDYETGKIDIDRLEGGMPASRRSKIFAVIDIVESLQKETKDVGVAIDDIRAEAENRGIKDIDDVIEKLRKEGTLFEPRAGFIRKV